MEFSDRYYAGITGTYVTGIGAPTVFTQMADNQKALIAVSRDHLSRQNQLISDLDKTNVILGNEIRQNTRIMQQGFEIVAREIEVSTGQMLDAVGSLQRCLTMHLGEISWQLRQQQETLDAILWTLQNSRKVEAQQLVRQSVSHMRIGEYAEAESRLKLALDYDTTDYQVLMNLGFVAVHKNSALDALDCFNKAVKRNGSLANEPKAQAYWEMARVYYASLDFKQALAHAEHAASLATPAPSDNLQLAIYAGLAGNTQKAVSLVTSTVDSAPELMGAALSAPDFESIRGQVVDALSNLATKAHAKSDKLHSTIRLVFSLCRHLDEAGDYNELWDLVNGMLASIPKQVTAQPTFSDCKKITPLLVRISQIAEKAASPFSSDSLMQTVLYNCIKAR